MTAITRFLVIAFLMLALQQPGFAQKSPDIKVTASIAPLHSIVAQVMKGVAIPSLLLEASQSSHHASLKPSQAGILANSDILFWIGPNLEAFLAKPVGALAKNSKSIALIDIADIELLQLPDGSTDPHIWLSTANAMLMTRLITSSLADIDAANADKYRMNLLRFETELNQLATELEDILKPAQSGNYLIYHDALRYFQKQFGFNTHSISVLNEELPPSAKQIAAIGALARSGEYQCIFIEPHANSSAIISVAKAAGLPVAVVDPVGSQFDPGPGQYSAMMRNVAQTIAGCSK